MNTVLVPSLHAALQQAGQIEITTTPYAHPILPLLVDTDLARIAAPDMVVLSEATRRLVRGIFVLEDLGPQRLKGIAEPVAVHRAVRPSGVRSRLDLAGGRLTPFVGRELELATLVDRFERAVDGEGQTVLLLGEAGVGKSRLAWQLRERLTAVPHTWLESRATPYTERTPFFPFIELLAQGLAFAAGDAYLAAAVQGANYSLGANPDNLSYCTGVGDNAQHFNFIVDAQVTGQLPHKIVGHIPYGQGKEGNPMSRGANAWVQQWLLNFGPTKKMVPNWFEWPVTEQYIDFAIYPLAQRELL